MAFLDNGFALGMSYVPWQMWENLYNEEIAFVRGCAFPSLYKPFFGRQEA